jgi:hypothetical protein
MSAIAQALVGAFATVLAERLLSHFGLSFSWLTAASNLIVGFVVGFLTHRVAVWEVLAVIAMLIGLLVIWGKMSAPGSLGAQKDYTSARIKGVDWKWQWDGRYPVNLVPFCPKCSAQLKMGPKPSVPLPSDTQRYDCPNCDFGGNWSLDTFNDVKLIVERNYRTGEYDT